MLAIVGLSISVAFADNASTLKTKIGAFAHGGAGTLSASVSGNTVTVTGDVTGAMNTLSLNIDASVTVLWKAAYVGSYNYGNVIEVEGSGTFEVAGGSIMQIASDGSAISAGTNGSTGTTIKVSSGTVMCSADGWEDNAIKNYANNGKIIVSGGTVQATGDNNFAINGSNYVAITISGGMILAKSTAVYNFNGWVTISGGVIFAYGTDVDNVLYNTVGGVSFTPTGNSITVAWNKAAGTTTYTAGTSTNIYKFPATATAVWAMQGSESGISVTNGTNTGFIPIADVTIGTTGIDDIAAEKIKMYPNPACNILNFSIETPFEITDLQGRTVQKSDSAVKSVNISSLPAGTYFVTVTVGTDKVVRKVVKE